MTTREDVVLFLFALDWILAAFGYIYVYRHRRPEISRWRMNNQA